MTKTVLIIGATSDIARATAAEFARAGWTLQLTARNPAALDKDAEDLRLRHGGTVATLALDVLDHAAMVATLTELEPLPDVVVCAVGLLGNQAADAADPVATDVVMRANYNGPAVALGVLANRFEARGSGVIVGISSVAGDRGRAANYIYGSAKAGFSAFLSGLRNRLAAKGVHVLTVKPGFVDTKMTEGMALPPRLTAQPEEVGRAVFKAVERRTEVLYVKPIWRLVMAIIRAIPERKFKTMRI